MHHVILQEVHHIKILDKFDVDCYVAFLKFRIALGQIVLWTK